MPDAFTPNLALIKPEIGASRDTWGAKLNANTDVIDDVLAMAMPIGAILDFAGPNAPPGWLIADGRLVSRTTYAALFAVIGTYWGAGDGSTTFALPPTPGRASIGPGTVIDQLGNSFNFSFTSRQGYVFNSIQQAHLPNYALTMDAQGIHAHQGGYTALAGGHIHSMDTQGSHSHGGATLVESINHTHTGTTAGVADHTHSVNAWATSGGGTLALGSVPTSSGTTTGPAGAHAHTFTTDTENAAHIHAITADGAHAHNIYAVADHQHVIYPDGSHAHTAMLGGGGQGFEVMGPVLVVTKIIYAGQQASTRVLTAAATAPLRRLSAPLRGSH